MIRNFRRSPTDKLCELGGGDNPVVHPQCMGGQDINIDLRMCRNAAGQQTVDIEADFNKPLAIKDNEWDGAVSVFALEHVGWRNVRNFLKEMHRIVKPGGYIVLVTPNTEAQIKWVQSGGWRSRPKREGMDDFEEASCVLFGDQNYSGNFHSAYFSPALLNALLVQIGFVDLSIQSFGETSTDMITTANKPAALSITPPTPTAEEPKETPKEEKKEEKKEEARQVSKVETTKHSSSDRSHLYGYNYFNNYFGPGHFYWDHPKYELIFRQVLKRKPQRVVELGCGRGYVLKRLNDAGIDSFGVDFSKHCGLTQVSERIVREDAVTGKSWGRITYTEPSKAYWDFCFSHRFLDHIPEGELPQLIEKIAKVSPRGLHGIPFMPTGDPNQVTIKPRDWWLARLPHGHEVVNADELEKGDLPDDYLEGDGSLKLNIGCAWTQFHYGFQNLDIVDTEGFSKTFKYNYRRHDVKEGLPYHTGKVDAIYTAHMLEHLNYGEAVRFLKECRRVIRPESGGMRIIVPHADELMQMYHYRDQDHETGMLDIYSLSDLDEVNDGCARSKTSAGKLWSILHEGHESCWDEETLCNALDETGWIPVPSRFRSISKQGFEHSVELQKEHPILGQILKETLDVLPCLSLYMFAVPKLGSN